jgi:hypothetical protein
VNLLHGIDFQEKVTVINRNILLFPGADAPVYLALLPKNVKSPRGAYIWCNRDIVDWVKGPTPGRY